jgi:hypothetical protein
MRTIRFARCHHREGEIRTRSFEVDFNLKRESPPQTCSKSAESFLVLDRRFPAGSAPLPFGRGAFLYPHIAGTSGSALNGTGKRKQRSQ